MKEVITAALHFVSCLSPLKGQPTICHVRFMFCLLFICVVPQHAIDPDSGRLGFICHPKTTDVHKELCFSQYSAEMSPLLGPYFFSLVTACALFALWTTMIQYSYLHLQKSRRVKLLSEKECLCHGFWNMILFHLGSEAVVLSVILGIFCYTQKIYFPETYNCTVMIATVITCRDQHHWVKSFFNIVFIGGMASILLLCIATVCQAVCNKEKFIKELLVLSNTVYAADDDGKHRRSTESHSEQKGDDGNHHSNTPSNNVDVGSHELTNASNQSLNEQRVASERCNGWNIDTAQVPVVVCHDLAEDIGKDWKMLGRRLHIFEAHLDNIDHQNHYVREKSISMLNKWQENVGKKATGKVLTETLEEMGRKDLSEKVRGKMLALAKKQLLTEGGLATCNIETGYADSSGQSLTQTPPPPESSLTSNTIRHR